MARYGLDEDYKEIWWEYPDGYNGQAEHLRDVAISRIEKLNQEIQDIHESLFSEHWQELKIVIDAFITDIKKNHHEYKPYAIYSHIRPSKYYGEYKDVDFSMEFAWESMVKLADAQRDIIMMLSRASKEKHRLIRNIYKECREKLYINYREEVCPYWEKEPSAREMVEDIVGGYIKE